MYNVIQKSIINFAGQLSAPFHVFAKNTDESYLFCNETMAQDLGLNSASEIVGRDDRELIWKDYAGGLQAHDQHVMTLGDNFDFIEPVKLINENNVSLTSYKYPMTNDNDEICGVFGISFIKKSSVNKLTVKQKQCINLAIQGFSAKEIAKIIGNSYRTVEEHIEKAKTRLGCRNITQLVYVYLKETMLEGEVNGKKQSKKYC